MLFHAPWYNSNKAHQGEGDEMMAAMEPVLHAAAVDVAFVGHVHAYERTVRMVINAVRFFYSFFVFHLSWIINDVVCIYHPLIFFHFPRVVHPYMKHKVKH